MNAICNGGGVEWVARQADCRRCFGRRTFFGRCQAWYDTDWTCSRCGAQTTGGWWRWGSPARDRAHALRTRALFVSWLLAGSPRIEAP